MYKVNPKLIREALRDLEYCLRELKFHMPEAGVKHPTIKRRLNRVQKTIDNLKQYHL